MQMLFQLDAAEGASSQAVEDAIATFWPNFDADPEGKEFANEAVRGVSAHRADIDRALQAASTHWRLERMPRVDRNVLRLSAWQLLYRTEIPKAVVIDEAVELAKEFGADDSGSFVNGVLSKIATTRQKT